MILKYWSVPILNESRLERPGPTPAQRRVQTTTTCDLRDRRLHALAMNPVAPGNVLSMIGWSILYFLMAYIVTIFVPGLVLAITKNSSLGWVFAVWAGPVAGLAVLMAWKGLTNKKMMRFALAERGLPARKVHIVREKD
jgi:hypothetical protein